MKVRIYSYAVEQLPNGDYRDKRRTQRTVSKLTPIQAARLLKAEGLGWNGYSEQFDNDGIGFTDETLGLVPFKVAEFWQ